MSKVRFLCASGLEVSSSLQRPLSVLSSLAADPGNIALGTISMLTTCVLSSSPGLLWVLLWPYVVRLDHTQLVFQ